MFFSRIREERDYNTIEFFLNKIPFLRVLLNDFLKQVATDIITILLQLLSPMVSLLKVGDPTQNIILELAKLLGRVEQILESIEVDRQDIAVLRVKRVEL